MQHLWVFLTIFAATMQIIRVGLQKSLAVSLDNESVTWARYGFAVPFALCYLWFALKITDTPFPNLSLMFIIWCIAGSVTQIFATVLLIILFKLRSFATCIAWLSLETLQLAILGFFIFGELISFWGGFAIFLGILGIFIMEFSKNRKIKWDLRVILIALSSAFGFGMTAFAIRHATMSLEINFLASTATALFIMIPTQALLLSIWLFNKKLFSKKSNAHPFALIWKMRKKVLLVSLTGFLGSIGWFTAFTLQHPAYVKTVARIEIVLALIVGRVFFREDLQPLELAGILIVSLAVILGILLT